MEGPWSEPVNLGISGHIDPGHVVGEDGQRYLFLSGVSRVRLSADGLATAGPVQHVYDGWRYPDDWVTEAYAPVTQSSTATRAASTQESRRPSSQGWCSRLADAAVPRPRPRTAGC